MLTDFSEECELGTSDKQICSIDIPSTVNFHIWTQYYGSHTKQNKDRISVNRVYNRKKKKALYNSNTLLIKISFQIAMHVLFPLIAILCNLRLKDILWKL